MTALSTEEGLKLLYQYDIFEALYTGNIDLKLRTILAIPGVIEAFEKSVGLEPTGKLAEMIQHYGEKYYTQNCEVTATPYQCFVRAARSGDVEVIRKYLPEITNTMQAAFEAGKYNQEAVINLLAEEQRNYLDPLEKAVQGAIVGGHFDLVDRLVPSQIKEVSRWTWIKLGKKGNLDYINQAIQRFPDGIDYYKLMQGAARGGHLELVKWALLQGIAQDQPYISYEHVRHRQTLALNDAFKQAVSGNHLAVAQYLFSRGVTLFADPNPSIWSFAGSSGSLEMINYLQTLSDPLINPIHKKSIVNGAAMGGYIDLIQMFNEPGMDLQRAMENAAKEGQIDIITYLLTLDASLEVLNAGLIGACRRETLNKFHKRQLIKFFVDAGANHWESARAALDDLDDVDQELVDFFNRQLHPA